MTFFIFIFILFNLNKTIEKTDTSTSIFLKIILNHLVWQNSIHETVLELQKFHFLTWNNRAYIYMLQIIFLFFHTIQSVVELCYAP